jgi:hypothetical protein
VFNEASPHEVTFHSYETREPVTLLLCVTIRTHEDIFTKINKKITTGSTRNLRHNIMQFPCFIDFRIVFLRVCYFQRVSFVFK